MLQVATWNVNSLKVRLEHVLLWLKTHQPHVLALQEIKMQDHDMPVEAFADAGYDVLSYGQKTYNGLAMLVKQGEAKAIDVSRGLTGEANEPSRLMALTYEGVHIVNVYVPNGEAVGTEKYAYKLSFGDALKNYLQNAMQHYDRLIVLGDFNIAPTDLDVHDPKRWHEKVLCSTKERELFKSWLELGLHDGFRECSHASHKVSYSWWDYRLKAFERNWGLRIDHILMSKPLLQACSHFEIDPEPRGWERPSDHTPVVAAFR